MGRQAAAFMYEYVELALVVKAAAQLSLQLEEGCFLWAAANKSRGTSKQGGYSLLFHLSAKLFQAAKLFDFIRKYKQLMEVIEYIEVLYLCTLWVYIVDKVTVWLDFFCKQKWFCWLILTSWIEDF